ncbi:MAG: terpene cyclase/mutase family protein [Lachnospiraceae bacterium]|nr:terpene cyclase/mutase family protein [Lachnospiraceae bacterium]
MRRILFKAASFIFAFVLMLAGASPAFADDAPEDKYLQEKLDEAYEGLQKKTGSKQILKASDYYAPGDSTGDWTAMAVAIAGKDDDTEGYLKGLREYIETEYASGGFDRAKPTEFQRMSLTILMLGGDPQEFAKDPEGNYLDLIGMGTYSFREGSPSWQGSNAVMYALVVMESAGVDAPKGSGITKESLIKELLGYQKEDGSFALSPAVDGFPDVTAMAIYALAPYRDDPEVSAALDKAVDYISGLQADDGGIAGFTGEQDCETISQVIMALASLGIDPFTDERFVKNGHTLIEALDRFRLEDGTYMHAASVGNTDYMSTESAMIALLSVQRRRSEDRWLFDTEGLPAKAEDDGKMSIGGIIALGVGVFVYGLFMAYFIKRFRYPDRGNGSEKPPGSQGDQ